MSFFRKKSGLDARPTESEPGIFLQGAFRRHFGVEAGKLTELVKAAFPEFAGRIECFGSDWLGRAFALDDGRHDDGQRLILMLEPGTGEALEIPCGLDEFLAVELVQFADAAVADDFFQRWVSSGGSIPSKAQCVGFKKPLFLGGADDLSNLELSDLDVYWSLMGQILDQIRGLPKGTRIGKFNIGD